MLQKAQFGVKIQQINQDFETLASKTKRCEELGYQSVWLIDHLLPIGDLPVSLPILECWTTLSALAVRTSKIRLGTMATCNLFRYPSLLAKMASTFDVISGGRLEFGIGAGWFEQEAQAYGVYFPKFSERAARLREAVKIIKLMWTEEKASFKGQYYSVTDAINNPKPVQKPHPPIWIGGQGEKRTFPVTAEVADATNLTFLTPEECKSKIAVLNQYCQNLGRRPEDIQKSLQNHIFIAENRQKVEETITKTAARRGISPQEVIKRGPIQGTPEQCVEQIHRYVDAGISYFILIFAGATDTTPMELFSDRVAPSFR